MQSFFVKHFLRQNTNRPVAPRGKTLWSYLHFFPRCVSLFWRCRKEMSPIVENGAPFWEGLAVADKPVSHIAFISLSRVDHLYFISTFYQLQMNITVKILLFLHPFCKPATAESDGITFCFLQHSHVSEFYFLFHFFAGFG